MDPNFIHILFEEHQRTQHRVQASAICNFMEGLMQFLFPTLAEQHFESKEALNLYGEGLQNMLSQIMMGMEKALPSSAQELAAEVMRELPYIYELLVQDASAIAEGDPAAQSLEEVTRTYPGFKAVAVHRVAHVLYQLRVPLLPRVLSEYAHAKTGIDIHPGASIGSHFCIDHGTGVVIGETTVIGKYVKVYQGVTLGALSVDKAMAKMKRHPTIEDHVVIYAGATILGGNTVIGTRSIIGGNVWLTESVPAYSRVYHRPQIKVNQSAGPADVLDFSI